VPFAALSMRSNLCRIDILCSTRLEKVKKERKQKEREKKSQESVSKKQLSNVRVIQRNLVYMTNISSTIAKEDVSSTFLD
jgi:CCR4-NOT transcription complex subunit 4